MMEDETEGNRPPQSRRERKVSQGCVSGKMEKTLSFQYTALCTLLQLLWRRLIQREVSLWKGLQLLFQADAQVTHW